MGYDSPASTIAICAALPVITLIAVVLRFSARRVQQTPIKLDDLLVLPALVSTMKSILFITHEMRILTVVGAVDCDGSDWHIW